MKNLKISQKIMVILSIVLLAFTAASIYSILRISEMKDMQDTGSDRANEALTFQEGAFMGAKAYRVIADGAINRDINNTEKNWAVIKKELIDDFIIMGKMVDNEKEKQLLVEANKACDEMIAMFENEMLPLLKEKNDTGNMVRIQHVDEKIDTKVDELNKPLMEINELLQAEAKAADIEFKDDSQDVMNTLITVCIIILILSVVMNILIARNIRNIIDSLILQTKDLVESAIAGKLTFRAKPEYTNPEFRDITVGINATLDAVIEPLNMAAEYVDRISKGDIPEKITANYNGDFNKIKDNLNQCIDAVNLLVTEANVLSQAAVDGRIDTRADASRHMGNFAKIIEGVNDTLNTLVGFIDAMPAPSMIIDTDYSILYINNKAASIGNSTKQKLKNTKCYDYFKTHDCNTDKCACRRAMSTATVCSSETKAHPGNWKLDIAYFGVPIKDKTGKINGAFEIVTDQTEIKQAVAIAEKIAQYQSNEVVKVSDTLLKLAEGKLDFNVAAGDSDEDTRNIKAKFEDIYNALESVKVANQEIVNKAKLVANGDLTVKLKQRSDQDELLLALIEMLARINETVTQVMDAAENVAMGSSQLSSTSIQVSQGANEQAAATEEASATVEEMTASTLQNSENAAQTGKTAQKVADDILVVNTTSEKSIEAMKEIIGKITIINDIAEKTDMLAINAAIEAARAGDHGKGFAVVAAEVRKLAEVSQKAAKEINDLSKNSLSVSEQAGKLMQQIIPNIQKTSQLVHEIASASEEQNISNQQISKALEQLSQVTQQNSAAAEEMSSSSEELASQAEVLKEVISFFKIEQQQTPKKKLVNNHKPNSFAKNLQINKFQNVFADELNNLDNGFEKI